MIFGGNTNDLLFQQGDAASDTSITATVDSQAKTALEFAEGIMAKYSTVTFTIIIVQIYTVCSIMLVNGG